MAGEDGFGSDFGSGSDLYSRAEYQNSSFTPSSMGSSKNPMAPPVGSPMGSPSSSPSSSPNLPSSNSSERKSSVSSGRIPPHHAEAERSVLGAILLNNESIHRVLEIGLEARDFYKEAHQKIFDMSLALSERGEPVDLVTMTTSLRDRGWFEHVGGSATLTSLFDDTFAIGNVLHYARIVRDKALLRRMIHTTAEIAAEAYDGVEDTEAYLDDAERKVFQVSDSKLAKSFSSMQEILVQNMHVIEEISQKKTDVVGLSTGFHDFDRLTSGLRPGQLVIIAARPAMGKTSLFLSMAQNIAKTDKAVVAIFSLEMSKEELGFRFLSGMTRIDAKRLKVGRLVDRDWPQLAAAADQLSKSKIFIDDSGDLTVMDIRARCRRLLSIEKRVDLIVVDYLQLMRGTKASQKGDSSREREISEISRSLKNLAKEQKVPIIALSQLNRGVESRPNKRPMLSDLRESGAIEQDADMVCFIYRDEVYNKESEDKGIAELIVAKHRAGETDTIRLAWLAEYTLFANLSRESPGSPIVQLRPDKGD